MRMSIPLPYSSHRIKGNKAEDSYFSRFYTEQSTNTSDKIHPSEIIFLFSTPPINNKITEKTTSQVFPALFMFISSYWNMWSFYKWTRFSASNFLHWGIKHEVNRWILWFYLQINLFTFLFKISPLIPIAVVCWLLPLSIQGTYKEELQSHRSC